ncbi:MAG: hypothetical protein P4L99_05465 [Chthoniobacter sp.]|nr:hypothetical protein [Chthoniobacter sp.]
MADNPETGALAKRVGELEEAMRRMEVANLARETLLIFATAVLLGSVSQEGQDQALDVLREAVTLSLRHPAGGTTVDADFASKLAQRFIDDVAQLANTHRSKARPDRELLQ